MGLAHAVRQELDKNLNEAIRELLACVSVAEELATTHPSPEQFERLAGVHLKLGKGLLPYFHRYVV